MSVRGKSKYNTDNIIEKFYKIHGNKYNYSNFEFTGLLIPSIIICKIHGEFAQTPKAHMKHGCKLCPGFRATRKFDDVIIKASEIHNNFYIYIKCYMHKNNSNLDIICPIHGFFTQRTSYHLCGGSCTKCYYDKLSYTLEELTEIGNKIYNFKYQYIKINESKGRKTGKGKDRTVDIYCTEHNHIFTQTISAHITNKLGCVSCIEETLQRYLPNVEEKLHQIHDNKYQYISIENQDGFIALTANCPKHGVFTHSLACHIQGKGCLLCAKNSISKKEKSWLSNLAIPEDKKHRNVTIFVMDKKFKVDGYDPTTKTIYEFYGDYWHGNPTLYNSEDINPTNKKTYGELYQKTIERENILKNAGYNLITTWENEYNKQIKQYKKIINNMVIKLHLNYLSLRQT